MNSEQLEELVEEIRNAIAKGHKGFTVRGAQMTWVVQALDRTIESQEPRTRLSVDIVRDSAVAS